MAVASEKLWLWSPSGIRESISLYTTSDEAGSALGRIKTSAGIRYIPLGDVTNAKATKGRFKINNITYAVLSQAASGVHRDSFTAAGSHTWECPSGVTKIRVTVAGAGGGGGGVMNYAGGYSSRTKGGDGELKTAVLDVTPGTSYPVIVGSKGLSNVDGLTVTGTDGGMSGLGSMLTARGGKGAYASSNGISYTGGGKGASGGDVAASDGWVYVEYGGDIK